jgi:hypothetical protein
VKVHERWTNIQAFGIRFFSQGDKISGSEGIVGICRVRETLVELEETPGVGLKILFVL